jgi:hypothetical protein
MAEFGELFAVQPDAAAKTVATSDNDQRVRWKPWRKFLNDRLILSSFTVGLKMRGNRRPLLSGASYSRQNLSRMRPNSRP